MKKLILFVLISGLIFASEYQTYKLIEFIKEMQHKKVKFLPIPDYNIFPVNIDNKVKIQQFIKAQSATIKLMAILGKEAYINGRWYKEGDKMQNMKILKITHNCVVFSSEDVDKNFKRCLVSNLIKVDK